MTEKVQKDPISASELNVFMDRMKGKDPISASEMNAFMNRMQGMDQKLNKLSEYVVEAVDQRIYFQRPVSNSSSTKSTPTTATTTTTWFFLLLPEWMSMS